jgi:two-component system NtrC family response regulator
MNVLLADDDNALRRVIQFKLQKKGYEVTAVENGEEALKELRKRSFDLLIADIRMPKVDGIQLLEESSGIQSDLKVILMTAYATVPQAVQAVKLGAFDYLTKPFDDDKLFLIIDKAFQFKKLEKENTLLKSQLQEWTGSKSIIGVSKAFKEMMSVVEKIAPTDASVLLSGESGTGKEVVARAIHSRSARSGNSFVAINCAAIPRDLIESELFGHEKGAFTGAVKNKKGKFELADAGTLLLDEISELGIDLQAKLLRAIQERVIEPVGSEKSIEVDVRLIATSNVNLRERVASGKFREDLFYRLNVIPIIVPPLRERREDIPILIKEFIRKHGGGQNIKLAPELMKTLREHRWPGNVRELENLIERMTILRSGDVLTGEDLPEDFGALDSVNGNVVENEITNHMTYQEAEEMLVVNALNRFGWNRTKAAKYLNIPRHVLIYRMKKYSITEAARE